MTTELSFGKYTILERLGSGGMAEIYKCRLAGIGGFDKLVVVKRILPDRLEEQEFVHMFLDEARIAANLNHPNVIHIFEVDEINGAPYMAMEYVRGPTLSALVRAAQRQQKMHLGHVAKIIADVCAGLYYVHNARDPNGVPLEIIHRDISPQNVLVSVEGVPKLLDFGVAKAVGRLAQTEAGMFKGKLRYSAPEHLQENASVDHRADVFSIGVCLYEATTGRPRFTNNLTEAQVIPLVLSGRVDPPSELVADYPPELERIIMWALEPDRQTRCPNAQALQRALEQFVASGPYASSTRAVVQWMEELFPPSEGQSYGRALSVGPGSGSSSKQQRGGSGLSLAGTASPSAVRGFGSSSGRLRMQVPSASENPQDSIDITEVEVGSGQESARPVKAALTSVGLMIALLAAGGGAAYLTTRQEPRVQPPVAQLSGLVAAAAQTAPPGQAVAAPEAPPSPPPSPLKDFLDEAERLGKEGRYGPALELLAKARQVQTQEPELVMRRTRLVMDVERESLLAKARMELRLYNVPGAIETTKQVLDMEPTNEQALALFADIRQASGSPSVTRARPRQRTGTLHLTAEPGGMVYLNDDPVGLSPIRQLSVPAGSYRLEVRLAGHAPLARSVRIQANRATALELKLVPLAVEGSTAPEASLRGAEAASSPP